MNVAAAPLVSVTTPLYNGERSLRACIESVLAQTYPHWDMTIVDNCSQDGSAAIAMEFAARDPRIRLVRNASFVPVVQNYNNAVRAASPHSAYCKVLAADDQLDPECLAKMVALAEAHPRVAIVGALGFGFGGRGLNWAGLPYPQTVFSGREVCRAFMLGGAYVFGTQTSVLYRTALVHGRERFFNEASLHPDTEVCLEFLREHDFGFVHQVLTRQGSDAGSVTSFSRRINTYLPNRLSLVRTYGPWYLAADELQRAERDALDSYYTFLSKQLLRRRDAAFWSFHRKALTDLGLGLSRARLARSLLGVVLDDLLNPKRALEWHLGSRERAASGDAGR